MRHSFLKVPMAIMFAFAAAQCHAGLIISEIMYKPSGTNNSTTTGDEWFEVFNAGPGSVDLSNYNYDDDADASTAGGGIRLTSTPTNLSTGHYAIIAQKSLSAWQTEFGTLPTGTTFLQIASGSWQALADGGEILTLYNRVTSTNSFSIDYTHPQANGKSIQFVGTNPALASPFSFSAGHWQDATVLPPGSRKDFHSAGTSTMIASRAPEPASFILFGMAGMGLTAAVRRQRKGQLRPEA